MAPITQNILSYRDLHLLSRRVGLLQRGRPLVRNSLDHEGGSDQPVVVSQFAKRQSADLNFDGVTCKVLNRHHVFGSSHVISSLAKCSFLLLLITTTDTRLRPASCCPRYQSPADGRWRHWAISG